MSTSNKTRVTLLSQAPGVGGGERISIVPLAKNPRVELTVIAPQPVCEFAESLGARSIGVELPRAHRLAHIPRLLAGAIQLSRLIRASKPDVVFAVGTRATPYALVASVLTGRPLVVHHVGLLTTGPTRSYVTWTRRLADAVVVPSRASGEPFEGLAKLIIVPTGIDLERFHPPASRDQARKALGLPTDETIVGCVTRADPRKGMQPFVKVAASIARNLRGVHFLLVGGATFPEEKAEFDSIKAKAGESGDRISVPGAMPDPVGAFQAMDLFVHLGGPEGFPTTDIEAMACGVPVVAYRWGGIQEIVDHESTGLLVEPNNEDAAEEAVRSLIRDPALRDRVSQQARRKCEENYDFSRYTEQLTDAVLSVAK